MLRQKQALSQSTTPLARTLGTQEIQIFHNLFALLSCSFSDKETCLISIAGPVHQNRPSPFASDFSLQTRVPQGIPQWESALSAFIAEESAVR